MSEASPTLDRRTTNTRSVIFAAVRDKGLEAIAERMGIAKTTLHDWLKAQEERMCLFMTAVDLKPVPSAARCKLPEEMDRLYHYAEKGIAAERAAEAKAAIEGDTGLHWEMPS